MASLDFPSNPTNNQTYSLNGVTYYYNAAIGAWLTQLSAMNITASSNTQVLFNDATIANGSPGLTYNKSANTLYANTVNVSGYIYGNGAYLTGLVTGALSNSISNFVYTGNLDLSSTTTALKIPVGTTAQRPTGAAGMIRLNSTTGLIEYYDTSSSSWIGLGSFYAAGGTESAYTSGGTTYKVHTFTSSGSLTVVQGNKTASLLLVAGGGGAGFDVGGGGGAGGCISTTVSLSAGTYAITIGSGGASSGTNNVLGGSGTNSTGFGYTAYGGGGGGSYTTAGTGVNGGSGGGAGSYGYVGGSGTAGQGYAGGTSSPSYFGTGGGGGATSVGANGIQNATVAGGSPLSSSINGTATNYAGGGYGTYDGGVIYQTGYSTTNTYLGYYGFGANGTGSPNASPYNGNPGICIVAYAT